MKETKEKRKMTRSLPWRNSNEEKESTEKNVGGGGDEGKVRSGTKCNRINKINEGINWQKNHKL